MNFTLAREIYGNPWFVDAVTMQQLTGLLKDIRAGVQMTEPEKKLNTIELYDLQDKIFITQNPLTPKNDDNLQNEYIAITNINGPITKHGGMSSFGMVDIASKFQRFDSMENVIGHIIIAESGGGSSNAVPVMTDVMKQSEKPIVTFIDDIAASAMYYIASYSDYIISKQSTAMVGSIGTMIEFGGYPTIAEDKTDGFRNVRIYADQSTEKNKIFEEAINNLNFTPVKEKLLNPHNQIFINDIKSNRPNVQENQLTGDIFDAQEVVGTLIDAVGSFEMAIEKVIEFTNINKNNSIMTKDELKAKHPDVYNDIRNEGITVERDRVSAFMQFVDVDADSVSSNILEGKELTNTFMAEMTKKSISKAQLGDIESESVEVIETPKVEEKVEEKNEIADFEAQVAAKAGLKLEAKS